MLATRRVFWAPYMPKLLLRPGLCPGPRWGSLQCSPRPSSWKTGRAPRRERDRREGKRKEGKGWELKGRVVRGREEREKEGREEKKDGEGRGREGSNEPPSPDPGSAAASSSSSSLSWADDNSMNNSRAGQHNDKRR